MAGRTALRRLEPTRALGIAVVLLSVLALVDVAAGPETVLAPLMVVAPCAVALVGRRREVVVTGAVALALLVALSWPDQLWGTAAQVYYLLAVVAATALTAFAAGRERTTEAALRGAHSGERRLAAIVASSDDAVIGKQLDGTITDWNAGAQRMYGWTAAEAVGRHISLIVPADRMAELDSVLDRVAAGRRVEPFDTRRVHRDGRVLDVSLAISPLLDADGTLVGASAVARDVTRLVETQARVAALVESAIDCIVLIDHEDRVLEFNPAAQETFGWTRDEAVGSYLHDLLIPPEEREAHIQGLDRFLRTGFGPIIGRSRTLTAQRKDGSTLPVEATITRLDRPGPPVFAGFLRDLSAQRAAEAERDKLDERLRQTERMDSLGELAGGIAHDFNNLLAVILNYAALMEDEVEEPVRRDVQAVIGAAERAAALTRQLLTFSRADAVRPSVVDLAGVVDPLVDLLRRTLPETIRIERHLAADASPVLADPTRLEQIVMNLAVNARDAMPDGGLLTVESADEELDALAAGALPDLSPGRYVRLAVSDTGQGMTREVAAHAFEPFFSTKPRGRGTGLGLATVYGIVRQMGGAVTLYSEVGRGTTVMLHLPAADDGAAELGPAPSKTRAVSRQRRRRVLLVEDEEMLRSAVARTLESAGHDVTTAASAEEALEIVAADDAGLDVLVSDITLPGLPGPALADRLRERWPDLAVLFCTGYTEHVMADRGDPRVEMIEKPFTLTTLLDRVDAVVAAAEAGVAAPDRPVTGADPHS